MRYMHIDSIRLHSYNCNYIAFLIQYQNTDVHSKKKYPQRMNEGINILLPLCMNKRDGSAAAKILWQPSAGGFYKLQDVWR